MFSRFSGEKIACFAPANFTESQAEALKEYCWNNGFWVRPGSEPEKSLLTQPHRYFPLYLPIQAVIFLSTVIFWNIMTKSRLLAILRGTEAFLDDLQEVVNRKDEEDDEKIEHQAVTLIRQFHETCQAAARDSMLSVVIIVRLVAEGLIVGTAIAVQFMIYDNGEKNYQCSIPRLAPAPIMCTVPILDLLDFVWSVNVGALLLSSMITVFLIVKIIRMYRQEYQPYFYNNLPYGDEDNFNENVQWGSSWVKVSYRLLIQIFTENNPIMTRAYKLLAMQPEDRKLRWQARVAKRRQMKVQVQHNFTDADSGDVLQQEKLDDESVFSTARTGKLGPVRAQRDRQRAGRQSPSLGKSGHFHPHRIDYGLLLLIAVFLVLGLYTLFWTD